MFPALFPKDSESLKSLETGLREVCAQEAWKKTDVFGDRQTKTDISTYRKNRPKGRFFEKEQPKPESANIIVRN